jgi:hypothetical protein
MNAFRFVAVGAILAGCALGRQTEFRATAVGSVTQGVNCVAQELTNAGYTVTATDAAGIVAAERGADRVDARILPAQELSPAHVIQVTTSPSGAARDAGRQVVTVCGT